MQHHGQRRGPTYGHLLHGHFDRRNQYHPTVTCNASSLRVFKRSAKQPSDYRRAGNSRLRYISARAILGAAPHYGSELLLGLLVMLAELPNLVLREPLKGFVGQVGAFFPDNVAMDPDGVGIELKGPLSLEMRASLAFFSFIAEVDGIIENLDLVFYDFQQLISSPPSSASIGRRRYFLLTRLFFYELLRTRDAFPRFLKRMQTEGFMSKEDRRVSHKHFHDQLEHLYFVRNVYLHGHSTPQSGREIELFLIAGLERGGYAPELVPKGGGETVRYPNLLAELARDHSKKLHSLAVELIGFFQKLIDGSALWVVENHFGRRGEQS